MVIGTSIPSDQRCCLLGQRIDDGQQADEAGAQATHALEFKLDIDAVVESAAGAGDVATIGRAYGPATGFVFQSAKDIKRAMVFDRITPAAGDAPSFKQWQCGDNVALLKDATPIAIDHVQAFARGA